MTKKRIITISREYGSGGRMIGEKVAAELGIAFYEKNVIDKIVEETGLSKEYVEKSAEYAPSASMFSYAFIGRGRDGFALADNIFIAQTKIIRDIAEKEPCVIVGRSSDFILKDRDDVLNIFIEGNQDAKLKRIEEIYKVPPAEAAKMIKDTDKKRSVNYQYTTEQKWGDRKNYDMILNSTTLGYDNIVKMICAAYRAQE